MSGRATHDPIPARPFLDWSEQRENQIRAELEKNRAITTGTCMKAGEKPSKAGEKLPKVNAQQRLLCEIGWDDEAGARRLRRWRAENMTGFVERADVEDALWRAGVRFDEIYPGIDDKVGAPATNAERMSKLTDAQVVAAHRIYTARRMTIGELAGHLWQRFDYLTNESCQKGLEKGFKRLGLPIRTCHATNARGEPCKGRALSGVDRCFIHKHDDPVAYLRSIHAKWQPPPKAVLSEEMLTEARIMHQEWGMGMIRIAGELIDRCTLRSPTVLAKRLAEEFDRRGWERRSPHRRRDDQQVAA